MDRIVGFLVIDKPGGMTSHGVVDRIRKRLDTRRVGHLGTLDPMARGVLPLALGGATRLVQFVESSPKAYLGQIRLGQSTTTDDAEGEPIGEPQPVDIERSAVLEAMAAFIGTIPQTPPAYSAKKIAGVPAYRLARRGIGVEVPPSSVTIEEFELLSFDPPLLEVRVVCSGGTYIRSLARDLGAALGTGAHLTSLRRTKSGPFTEETAVAIDGATPDDVIGPESVLTGMGRMEVDDAGEEAIRHGRRILSPATPGAERGHVCIFNKKGRLIAVALQDEGWASPRVVLL